MCGLFARDEDADPDASGGVGITTSAGGGRMGGVGEYGGGAEPARVGELQVKGTQRTG